MDILEVVDSKTSRLFVFLGVNPLGYICQCVTYLPSFWLILVVNVGKYTIHAYTCIRWELLEFLSFVPQNGSTNWDLMAIPQWIEMRICFRVLQWCTRKQWGFHCLGNGSFPLNIDGYFWWISTYDVGPYTDDFCIDGCCISYWLVKFMRAKICEYFWTWIQDTLFAKELASFFWYQYDSTTDTPTAMSFLKFRMFHNMGIFFATSEIFGSSKRTRFFWGKKTPGNLWLGGGNSNIFNFHPEPWGFMIQFDLRIFFKWVGSTTN